MEFAKRIVNLIYALINLFFIWLVVWSADPTFQHYIDKAFPIFRMFAIAALVTAVINFALFKKFTIWNK